MKYNFVIVTARRLEYAMQQLWAKVRQLVQDSIQPAEKEVIECQARPSSFKYDGSEEGIIYLDYDNDELLEVEGTVCKDVNPSSGAVYVVTQSDNTIKLYVWRNTFIEASSTEAQSDGEIVGTTLDVLNSVKTAGIYKVTLVQTSGSVTYTLYVTTQTSGGVTTVKQTVVNQKEYATRDIVGTTIGDWDLHCYSFEGHTHTVSNITGLENRLKKVEKLAAAGL